MAKIKIKGADSGSAVYTLTTGTGSTDRTITLPDGSGTLAFTTGDDDKLPLAGGTMTGTIAGFTSTGIDDNADATAITINSSEQVGIGTTSPDSNAKLHVYNGASGQSSATNNTEVVIENNGTTGISFLTPNNASSGLWFADPESNAVGRLYYTHSDNSLNVFTNSTQRLKIDGSGNVGIGTTSPTNKLTVQDSSYKIHLGTQSADPTIHFTDSSNSTSDGALKFYKLKFKTDGGVTNMLLDQHGNLDVKVGNLVIGTAGKGIDFSANSHASGMSSEILDDYEEGTWTPTLSGTTGGPSGVNFDFRTGWYTKIGRQVTAAWIIGMSSWSSGPSGNALISGLPFNAMTDTNFNMSPVIGYSSRFNTDNAPRGGFIESNTSVVRLLRSADTSSRNNVNTNVTCSGLGGDEYIYGQITYFTA